MLRLLVLLLLLANGGYFAWSQGHLLAFGLGPAQQAEPQRLRQQIRPEAIQVVPAADLRELESAQGQAPRAADCLASPTLDAPAVARLRTLLEGWPAGSWSLEQHAEPPRWIVYMGRYADVEEVARKRDELRRIGVSFEPLANPQLEPGLSLGIHPTEAAALQQLQQLVERGVRTARVVQERPEQRGQRLLLPSVDDTLRPRLQELRPVLNNRPLRPCR